MKKSLVVVITVIVISLSTIYTVIPGTIFVQPLEISNIESQPYDLHEGDRFRVGVLVTNPNFFTIHPSSSSTSFDRNAIEHHNSGCACCGSDNFFTGFQSNGMSLPTASCDEYMATSAGEANATVNISYTVNGVLHTVSASKMFTILPK